VGVTVDANGRSWSVRVNDLANFTNRLALEGEYLFVGGFETGGPATVGRPGASRWRCPMELEGRAFCWPVRPEASVGRHWNCSRKSCS